MSQFFNLSIDTIAEIRVAVDEVNELFVDRDVSVAGMELYMLLAFGVEDVEIDGCISCVILAELFKSRDKILVECVER